MKKHHFTISKFHKKERKEKNNENENVMFQQICFSRADKYSRGVEHKGGEGALFGHDTNIFRLACLNVTILTYQIKPIYIGFQQLWQYSLKNFMKTKCNLILIAKFVSQSMTL